jgi:hypothetical protein
MLGPSLVTSVGLGMCLVTMTIAATSGVPHSEAGAVSGLLNTSRQVGGAVGLAVLVTVAAAHTNTASPSGTGRTAALVAGYDRAFLVTAGFFVLAAIAGTMLPGGRARRAVAEQDGAGSVELAPSSEPA